MSIDMSRPIALQQKHDHVRPNASNPLVHIRRTMTADETFAAAARAAELDPRGQPSKGGKVTDLNAPTPCKPSLPLPERFKQPELWQTVAAPQHPLYRTSSQSYGQRPPAIQELPSKYFGNSHTFTNTFAGGMARDFGLNTSISRSRVIGSKEEFGFN